MSYVHRVAILVCVVVASALVLADGTVCAVMADELPKDSPAEGPPPYKGKTVAEWIELLSAADAFRLRAEAAEVLGFLAREGQLNYGGFSDVPIDSPEPPKLKEEALRLIVAALVGGLSDMHERVRASSAIALSWIGSRAHTAVPALVRLLDDGHKDARNNALSAIGRIGPAAKEAIPHLQPLLARGDGHARVGVAGTMRLIGAAADTYVPTLIEVLAEDGHYAAMELGQLGNPAVAALKQALKDKNAVRRAYAAYAISNMAGWGNLTTDREAVAHALADLTQDSERSVVWRATQAIGSVHASAERCVPALTLLLKHPDQLIVKDAAESLGDYGADATSALPALIALLGKGNDEDLWQVAYAIREIGIDRASADAIRRLTLKKQGYWFFVALCRFPESALEFLRKNPHAIEVPVGDRDALIALMRDPDPASKALQEALCTNEQLPLAVMAELQDARFLPLLERKLKTAHAHEKTTLEACSRACGSPAKQVVNISESQPGEFKPKSAWPGTDPARTSPNASGHGDGYTEVIITGRILRDDGKPAVAPRFLRTNDSLLLGERIREEEPIVFDGATGRFVFVTDVFAAYSSGNGQREPGPYQTGSSMVQIESEGCKPLVVQFYDEMPDVQITLTRKNN